MTKTELKAELLALYDQAILSGELSLPECEKLSTLWANRAECKELYAEHDELARKGRIITAMVHYQLAELRIAKLREQTKTTVN